MRPNTFVLAYTENNELDILEYALQIEADDSHLIKAAQQAELCGFEIVRAFDIRSPAGRRMLQEDHATAPAMGC